MIGAVPYRLNQSVRRYNVYKSVFCRFAQESRVSFEVKLIFRNGRKIWVFIVTVEGGKNIAT